MPHKKAHNDLTAGYVRKILAYNRRTGLLTWRVRLSIRAPVGKIAGCKQANNRIKIGINGKDYMAHRIIWLWMTGAWPEYEIDHCDEDQSNNRWKNLRQATPSQNHRNRGPQKNNKTGHKGVCFYTARKQYIAFIKHEGTQHILGCFKTLEPAIKARLKAEKKFHGKWAKNHVPPPHRP